jgi:hypothetical protein
VKVPGAADGWATSYLILDEAIDRALQIYYLGCDKMLAMQAAYRALGMDPTTVPRFNWNMPDTTAPPSASGTTTAPSGVSVTAPAPVFAASAPAMTTTPAPSSSKPSWLKRTALAATAIALPLAGYEAARYFQPATPLSPNSSQPPAVVSSTPAPAGGWQYQIEERQPDGTWKAIGVTTRVQPGGP